MIHFRAEPAEAARRARRPARGGRSRARISPLPLSFLPFVFTQAARIYALSAGRRVAASLIYCIINLWVGRAAGRRPSHLDANKTAIRRAEPQRATNERDGRARDIG
ncbi:hypothetical protein EVAR_75447_1 [Eumeta japonica]|uniref:Uncharacterized protein n=1 Tax=Eumeta variegata TaxID=151549 RepID=A0A4C1TK40_EUMVA|nr:hypothetical protein EVAR_75447_1 [Eumeta japonica]